MEDRRQLRKATLARRDRLPDHEMRERSSRIRERLLAMEVVHRASVIMVYVNYRSEVITRPLIAALQDRGINVAAPLTDPGSHRLTPYRIQNATEDLIPGYCNIPEPDSRRLVKVDPSELDIVLVPGSVFDPGGGRLGYGGGYYDRFLSLEASRALTIGLAYEVQVVEKVPLLDHDVPLDWVVTEERILEGRGGAAFHSFDVYKSKSDNHEVRDDEDRCI